MSFRNEDGNVTDVIGCCRPGKAPDQSCEHYIEAGIFDVMISYASEFLPDWKRFSVQARSFFSCMKTH
ncbi:hypothetical protein K3727_15645 [Rhodobacteraceae bacterium M382]|nr:hypothetical protein K3727_15645 [Rhodobacteraceae bacterium M382]